MQIKFFFLLLLPVLALIAAIPAVALAHEEGELGDVSIEIGFETEPPFEGIPNGVSIVATRPADEHAHEDAAAASGINVNEHGGVFEAGGIEPGESFTFEATPDLEGLAIPFHNHFNHDATGEIHVESSAPEAGAVEVQVHADHFEPAHVEVRPGTTVTFTNMEETPQNVVSGLGGGSGAGASDEVPVDGLEQTVKVEITHTASGSTRELELEPVFGEPGHYIAQFIPTATGQYSVRLFGTIDGVDVEKTFVSGPGTFDDVVSAASVQFPNIVPSAREIESAVRGAQELAGDAFNAADDADSSATTALIVGIIGIVTGISGVGVGAYAIRSARRKAA